MKTMELCGMTFEIHKGDGIVPVPFYGYDWDAIWKAYRNPSQAKQGIWHDWCDWVDLMNTQGWETGIEISSHSCMMFSITGTVVMNNKVYAIWITKEHNRIYAFR